MARRYGRVSGEYTFLLDRGKVADSDVISFRLARHLQPSNPLATDKNQPNHFASEACSAG